jgi:pimeloyl-ACP methyl ester carboxylesterase
MEWIIALAVIAVGVCTAAWWGQERLIFFPQPLTSTAHLPARAAPLELTAADGVRIRGWIVGGAGSPAPAVICFGGNAEEVSWLLSEKRWPREWTIVAVNYRGYGASEGAPGEGTLTSDALAIFDAIARRADVDPQRIVVFGRSLGTAIAAYVAAERPVAGAILASPFDSLAAVGRQHYPWLPVSLLLRHRFDAASLAIRNRMPLLVVAGENDSIVPPARSRALFDAWAGPKTWQVIADADHNDLGAFDAFWDGVARFLRER